MTRCRTSDDGERGGVLVLTLGALALAAALIATLAVASAVYLDRKELLALADATAAAAATHLDEAAYAAGKIRLTDDGVRSGAHDFLASAPPGLTGLGGITVVDPTGAPDPATAQVTLRAYSRPSFLPWALIGWSDGFAITVTSSARGG